MQRLLLIVGTGHHYQFGVLTRYGKYECAAEDHAAFAQMLRELAKSHTVDSIAEELNEEAMSEVGSAASVPQLVARELGLHHLFCEPDRTERQQLGIMDENSIRVSTFPKMLDEATVQRLAADSWQRREKEWLRRLSQLSGSRIFFVCGANHVVTFVPLALEHSFQVTVVHGDWEATNPSVNATCLRIRVSLNVRI